MYNAPNISPNNKQVDPAQVAELPKVVLNTSVNIAGARGEGDVEAAVREVVAALANDHVAYAEIRLNPAEAEAVDNAQVLAAAARGVRAQEYIDARLLIIADTEGVGDAVVAYRRHADDPRAVVGVALTEAADLKAHAEVLGRLRAAYIPVTIDAGARGDVEAIATAVAAGAQRLGLAGRVFEDFSVDTSGITAGETSAWVRDRGICLELAPTKEVALGVVEEFADHPLTLLQQMGFTVTVNPADAEPTVTDELMRLVETFDYGYDELFDLTRTALEHAFVDTPRRHEIMAQTILPAYEELTGAYNEDAAFAEAHHDHEEQE
ncbi:adenosine deaminase family protein [Corynebacterium yudongzhengii]|nr:adenosine deaminase family protein [Corynebacterium yudongzhengii]